MSDTALVTKLKALIEDFRTDADTLAAVHDPTASAQAEIYYQAANRLEVIVGEDRPMHTVGRPPEPQPRPPVQLPYKPPDTRSGKQKRRDRQGGSPSAQGKDGVER